MRGMERFWGKAQTCLRAGGGAAPDRVAQEERLCPLRAAALVKARPLNKERANDIDTDEARFTS